MLEYNNIQIVKKHADVEGPRRAETSYFSLKYLELKCHMCFATIYVCVCIYVFSEIHINGST